MRRSARWPAVLVVAGCLVFALLGGALWRLIEQERVVERARLRERLENGASLVVRESERALAQAAADERTSLSVGWDAGGLRRVAGRPLLWSPAPEEQWEAPGSLFEKGEELEFAKSDPEQAIAQYTGLLKDRDVAVRAGALVRIARCQRKRGRPAEAVETYKRLVKLGTANAELVGYREQAALLEAAREDRAEEARDGLKAALERPAHPPDRATFEFYAQGITIDPDARLWSEAVEQLWERAGEVPSGAVLFPLRGRWFVAEWGRQGNRGTGRLVDFQSVEQRLAAALGTTGLQWRLTGGGESGSPPLTGTVLTRRPAETGLPWGVEVAVPSGEAGSRAALLASGLVALSLAILATLYLAYRALRRELDVAAMQSEFVAAVSHEFRTPITALTHLTEMLDSGEAAEERKPLYYRALARETRRLREMVENLLDFGRIESGRYRYKPEELDAAELVSGVVEEFRSQPAAEGRELVFDPGPRDVRIAVDREAFRRALWNLLDNAARYSPAGSRITARLSGADGWARIGVQDEGPGIAPEERKRIFQKFVRGSAAGEHATKGTGIGLAMVDAIARAHGGRVELESAPGAGSRFTIVLPGARRN